MGDSKWLKNVDWKFMGLLGLVLGISLVVLSSASANVVTGQPYYYLKKQSVWIIIGLVAMFAVASFDYRYFEKMATPIYLVNLAVLVAVLLLGNEAKGAQRWISIGSFEFQPSEFAKIAIVLSFASFLSRRQGELTTFRSLLPCFLYIGAPMLLILKQPDLGTSLVFIAIMLGMLWAAGTETRLMRNLILLMGAVVIGVFALLFFATAGFTKPPDQLPVPLPLKTYQLMRLIIFVNPDMDPLGAGYHVIQSQVAIGSGGFWGKGLGNGSQVQGNFLPEHHTDFIFSVVGEELGFVGATIILAVFFLLINRIIKIAAEARDLYGTLVVVGLTSMLGFHVLINAGMTIGIMPVTGVPMPFLSAGGSSLLTNMISMGLILNVSLRKEQLTF